MKDNCKDRFLHVLCLIFLSVCFSACSLPRIVVLDDPLGPEEHLNLGVTYEKNGELDNALEEYKKAIENEPDSADAYNNLAWLYCTEKTNLDEAEALVLKALQLNPSKQDIYNDTLERIRELKRSKE